MDEKKNEQANIGDGIPETVQDYAISKQEDDKVTVPCSTVDAASSHEVQHAKSGEPATTSSNEKKKSSKFKIKPFTRMVLQLEEMLSLKNVTDMAKLSEQTDDFLTKIAEKDTPFYYLSAQLVKQNVVSDDDVDALVELFEAIKADGALEVVKRYKQSLSNVYNSDVNSGKEDISPEDTASQANAPTEDREQPDKNGKEGELSQTPASVTSSKRATRGGRAIACSWENVSPILDALGLGRNRATRLGITDAMVIGSIHLHEDVISPENAVMAFINRLTSYDYRAVRLFKELEYERNSQSNVSRQKSSDPSGGHNILLRLSCRDILYAIILKCDYFLRRQILSKLSACQNAIPVLLPNYLDEESVTLLLWGLQSVTKVWRDPCTSQVHEKSVTKFAFPVVTALKYGRVTFSKSNILNKTIGSCQGNDDHPYFLSQEQDSKSSYISQGTLEAVWCLPGGGKKGRYSLGEAVCFLNLRGDATIYPKQKHFVLAYSIAIVVFISKTDMHKIQDQIDEMSRKTNVIVVMGHGPNSFHATNKDGSGKTVRNKRVRAFDASVLNTLDISEKLCTEINDILSEPREKPVVKLEEMISTCKDTRIEVDIFHSECIAAKKVAEDILSTCKTGPKEYKLKVLPLQYKWQKWSQLDKDRSWKKGNDNVEMQLSQLYHAKEEQRRQQREIGISEKMKKLYEGMSHTSDTFKQFLIFWLQDLLNETSLASLRPLVDALRMVRDELRSTAAKMTQLQRRIDSTVNTKDRKDLEGSVKELELSESRLHKELAENTQEFDACSLGLEHLLRELGQIYECFHNCPREEFNALSVDVKSLPFLAARILLTGHPIEIFDGDACNLPTEWIKGVFLAIREILGDVRVYVISVIGIQSSGKSTLLNSMFGVQFAVSSGRCTRGVFLQLLPVCGDATKEIGCDFIAIVDTEGLKAPEKAISNRKNEDNELATLALCISDMTLINIGGQTVGEDLSNILQISAHAFIRMKEVHLRSSCYLVQQFVADITAEYRNQSSTQSILQKLDEAVVTAAIEERKQNQYRHFSDCFNIVNIQKTSENIQLVPSLWRSSMSAPNYEYGETVLKLKSHLLEQIKNEPSKHSLTEFLDRIVNVWNAVKQEDFVFNFRNTTEISQYNSFTLFYKRQQLQFTEEMMKWELEAKQKVRNSTADNVTELCESLVKELNEKLTLENRKIQISIEECMQSREFESVRKHATYFLRDLQLVQKHTKDTVSKTITAESSFIVNTKTKEKQLLPHLIAQLRNKVLQVAESLRPTLPQNEKYKSDVDVSRLAKDKIRTAFDQEWTKQMKNVQLKYPTPTETEIRQSVESDIEMCIMDIFENTNVSKDMKHLLNGHNLQQLCMFPPIVFTLEDLDKTSKLIGPCSNKISKNIDELMEIASESCEKIGFIFSPDFAQRLKTAFGVIVRANCEACREKTTLLTTLACKIVLRANKSTKDTILSDILRDPNLMRQLGLENIASEEEIRQDVSNQLKKSSKVFPSGLLKKFTNMVGDVFVSTLFHTENEKEDNFNNQLRTCFFERINRVGPKWYCPKESQRFLEMACKRLKNLQLTDAMKQQFLADAFSFYIQEAIQSEKDDLARRVCWLTVQATLQIASVSLVDQMSMFKTVLTDVLPHEVQLLLTTFSEEDIEKFAQVPVTENMRHSVDQNFISLAPRLHPNKYHTILNVIRNSRELCLSKLKSNEAYNTHIMRSLIASTLEDLTRCEDLGQYEKALTIGHLCSWALPICIAIQVQYEEKVSLKSQFERERQRLFLDFKSLCEGACKDHIVAKSFCTIIEESLIQCLKNRICTILFERLRKTGDEMFCSRPHFLKVMLEDLCQKEKVDDYVEFLHNHSSFIQKWTLNFIATACWSTTKNYIDIKDIAIHEIDTLLRETDEALEKILRTAIKSVEENDLHALPVSFQEWIADFSKCFESVVKSSLNEHKVSELCSYTEVSDYSLFGNECKRIFKSSVRSTLIQSLHMPNVGSLKEVITWFENLPKRLDHLLAKSVGGCGSRCPFCKTLCDDTIKEHNVHFSNLHYPRGVSGGCYRGSKKLVCDACTALVGSDTAGYFHNCTSSCDDVNCTHPATLFKDYRIHYPQWNIKPIRNYEPTLYWKWVFTTFNKELADYYGKKPGEIPWGKVTKRQALDSIRSINE